MIETTTTLKRQDDVVHLSNQIHDEININRKLF